MSRYELARAALDDLDELWLYIAEDSLDAAYRTTDAILDACALLVDHPHIGHTRTDLTDRPVLFRTSGKYLIVYRPETASNASGQSLMKNASPCSDSASSTVRPSV